jgi:hypothetical protein
MEIMSDQAVQISKSDVLELICRMFPWIAGFQHRTLADFAHAAFDVEPSHSRCEIRQHAKTLLGRCVHNAARRAGFSADTSDRFRDEILEFPVLQTGPHLHLLVEPDAYYTHLFSLMGIRAHRRPVYISYAVSTVKFVERGRKGPGWLRLGGDAFNVFGLTRSRMIPYSVLARNGPYRFKLINVDRPNAISDAGSHLMSMLPQGEFSSASAAIKQANIALWKKFFDARVDLLQLDDDDIADLVVEHLSDNSSWLARELISDQEFAANLLRRTEEVCASPWGGWFKHSTDFFWGSDKGRLFPLRLAGRCLRASKTENYMLPYEVDELIAALRAHRIIPNLFLMFIVTAMLPGVRVLGGSRHTIYYPLMRYVLASTLQGRRGDGDLIAALAADFRPGVWGHRVLLREGETFAELEALQGGDVSAVLDQCREMPLTDACGSLESFVSDPVWANLKTSMAQGAVSPERDEWGFS